MNSRRRTATGAGQGAGEPPGAGRPHEGKSLLRVELRAQLRQLTAEYRAQASNAVCRRLPELPVWRRARSVLAYAPRSDELDICPVIVRGLEEGKQMALPQFVPATGAYRACRITGPVCELAVGTFGIREPGEDCPVLPLNQLDLVLVPGLAFDLAGRRLGRGRGYYDLLLASVTGIKCGLAFDEQMRPEIPVETHDIVLDCILTPTRWRVFSRPRFGDDLAG